MKMSIDPNHCLVACLKAEFEYQSVFSRAMPVMAIADDRRFVTDPTQQ